MVQCYSQACEYHRAFRTRCSSLVEVSGSTPPKLLSLPRRRVLCPHRQSDAFLQQRIPTVVLRVHARRADISGDAKLFQLVETGLTHVMSTLQGPRISQRVSTDWADPPVGIHVRTCFDV